MGAYQKKEDCNKQESGGTAVGLEKKEAEARAEGAGKVKTVPSRRPPDCGQVPVAISAQSESQVETPAAARPDSSKESITGAKVEASPVMPVTQMYSPHIAVISILLSVIFGLIVFRARAKNKRLCKQCPHCNGRLERWADDCRHCGKNIFVYPTL
jgi:hypothetical protein